MERGKEQSKWVRREEREKEMGTFRRTGSNDCNGKPALFDEILGHTTETLNTPTKLCNLNNQLNLSINVC